MFPEDNRDRVERRRQRVATEFVNAALPHQQGAVVCVPLMEGHISRNKKVVQAAAVL